MAKYGIVGVGNTLITIIVYFLLRRLGTEPGIANAAGYAAGFANSFLFNKLWVFRSRSGGAVAEATLFCLGALLCWLLQLAAFHGLLGIGTGETVAYLIGMCIYTATNYSFNKWVTFRKRTPHRPPSTSPRKL